MICFYIDFQSLKTTGNSQSKVSLPSTKNNLPSSSDPSFVFLLYGSKCKVFFFLLLFLIISDTRKEAGELSSEGGRTGPKKTHCCAKKPKEEGVIKGLWHFTSQYLETKDL